MEKAIFIWLALLIVFLVIEVATVGLAAIWMAGGSLAAMLAELIGLNIWWQIGIFIAVSFLLLIFTRPFAVKYINSNREKTNYEGIIGKVVRITETVNNYEMTGTAVVNGIEWTVRTEEDGQILNPGDLAKVMKISGVKLIVKKYEED